MTKPNQKQKEAGYLIPELEIRVTPAWIRLIRYCQVNLPNGQLCVKINNTEPGNLVTEHTKRSIRFDREQDIPIDFGEV